MTYFGHRLKYLPRVKYHSSISLRTAKTFLYYTLIFRMFVPIYVMSSLVRVLRFVVRRWRVLRRSRGGRVPREGNPWGHLERCPRGDSAKVSARQLPGGVHDAALQTSTRRGRAAGDGRATNGAVA